MNAFKDMWLMRRNREKIYRTAEYWDSRAMKLQGDAASMWPNNNLNRYYRRDIQLCLRHYLPHLEGARALEVGCGTGYLCRFLAGQGALVLGVDFSPQAVARAQELSPSGNPAYRLQSMFDLEDECAFDVIISWASLTLACRDGAELRDVLFRLRRSLASGGRSVFIEPIHKGFLHRVLNMDVHDFCGVMVECGFKVQDVSQLHFWPMRMLLAHVAWPRFMTAAGYYFGEVMMKAFGGKVLGEYKVVYATA